MKRQIEIAFTVALFGLSCALFVGFSGAGGVHTVARVLLLPLLATVSVLYVLKRRKTAQRGFMNADKRPPLTPDVRKAMTAHFIIYALSTKKQADNETPIVQPLTDEIARLSKLWKEQGGGNPLSDDEIRSLDILTRFVTPFSASRPTDAERDTELLSGVADPGYFYALREKVAAWEKTQPRVIG